MLQLFIQVKMANILCSHLLKCEDDLLFHVLYNLTLNIFGFVGWTKQDIHLVLSELVMGFFTIIFVI